MKDKIEILFSGNALVHGGPAIIGLRCEKTCLLGFGPCRTQNHSAQLQRLAAIIGLQCQKTCLLGFGLSRTRNYSYQLQILAEILKLRRHFVYSI